MKILELDLDETQLGPVIKNLAADPLWGSGAPALSDSLEPLVTVARTLARDYLRDAGSISVLRASVLSSFVHDVGAPWGLAVISNLPRGSDPRRSLLLLAEILGRTVKFEDEGDYLIEVREDLNSASLRPGFNNSKEFFPHTDLSYVADPPVFFCLHSIENNVQQGGISEFVDIREIVDYLSPDTLVALQQSNYLFPAPKHFAQGGSVQQPILEFSGTDQNYLIRFRRDNLRATNRDAIDAVIQLCKVMQERMTEIFLAPDAVAIINNQRVLHGRTAFLGGDTVSRPRHINRLYFDRQYS